MRTRVLVEPRAVVAGELHQLPEGVVKGVGTREGAGAGVLAPTLDGASGSCDPRLRRPQAASQSRPEHRARRMRVTVAAVRKPGWVTHQVSEHQAQETPGVGRGRLTGGRGRRGATGCPRLGGGGVSCVCHFTVWVSLCVCLRCRVTNHHTPRDLKCRPFIMSQFLWCRNLHSMAGSSAQSHRLGLASL